MKTLDTGTRLENEGQFIRSAGVSEDQFEESEYSVCIGIFEKQLAVLSKISQAQSMVRNAVMHKKWIEYNMLLESMNSLSGTIQDLEERRMKLFDDSVYETNSVRPVRSENLPPTFYTFVMRFNDDERSHLCSLYRQLKNQASKVHFENTALNEYLDEQRVFISHVISEAYPQRRGKLYNKKGILRKADMRSIVINARL
ncbi:MAG: hypothetical protein Ta2F_06170 [Termitinemataceae bacterium]|nr:MAG: hypothetical protein Ta2F_06170 [Termitinemataceae bacterium]